MQGNQDGSFICKFKKKPKSDRYDFELVLENNVTKTIHGYNISIYDIMIPDEPMDLKFNNITSNSVVIEWKLPLNYALCASYFQYDLIFHSAFGEEMIEFDGNDVSTVDAKQNRFFRSYPLKYANTMYNGALRIRSSRGGNASSFITKNFTTLSKRPLKAPAVDSGGFYIKYPKELYIYFEKMEKYEENAPDFRYFGLATMGKSYHSFHLNMTEHMPAIDTIDPDMEYEIHLFSENQIGKSSHSSILKIPRQSDKLPNVVQLKNSKDNQMYYLSWEIPSNIPLTMVTSYTVFWCKAMQEKANYCDDGNLIDFQRVNATTTNFSIESNSSLNFAVSINSANSSSGMKWIDCTGFPSRGDYKLISII